MAVRHHTSTKGLPIKAATVGGGAGGGGGGGGGLPPKPEATRTLSVGSLCSEDDKVVDLRSPGPPSASHEASLLKTLVKTTQGGDAAAAAEAAERLAAALVAIEEIVTRWSGCTS
jgi:hypothetical protein